MQARHSPPRLQRRGVISGVIIQKSQWYFLRT